MFDPERHLIIPHESVDGTECCACLCVTVRDGQAEIVCNEWGAVIRTVLAAEVRQTLEERRRKGRLFRTM
jgi:hypothetical protein